MAGEHLDLSSEPETSSRKPQPSKPFLGVRFQCCSIYARIYLNANGDQYAGACPRCAKPVRFQVAPGGSSSRFFDVW
ncbi:MAG: hypothetical protein QGG36_09270 [Pirellulaceae bacterium]|jgi:hypothetical protein|nr:hypothetical protein [Pirellulaceae bacterium]MDP7015976.1 hypothetical protein [Pirellulaceae bacterium]